MGVAFLAVVLVGSLVGFMLLKSNTDLRNQASVQGGLIKVSTSYAQSVAVGVPVAIEFKANTSGANLQAIILSGSITGVPVTNITFTPDAANTLPVATKTLTAEKLALTFSAGSVQKTVLPSEFKLGTLTMTPKQDGVLKLNWDNTQSKGIIFGAGGKVLYPGQVQMDGSSGQPDSKVGSKVATGMPQREGDDGPKIDPVMIGVSDSLVPLDPIMIKVGTGVSPAGSTSGRPVPSSKPPLPAGCYYMDVQCIKAPCDPVPVCPSPGSSFKPPVRVLEIN